MNTTTSSLKKHLAVTTILKRTDVERETSLSRSSIYKFLNEGKFPKPINLGGGRVGWLASEIEEWIQQRINARG